jgi:hypothetical protein
MTLAGPVVSGCTRFAPVVYVEYVPKFHDHPARRRSGGGPRPPGRRGAWRKSEAARPRCVQPRRRPGWLAPRRSATSRPPRAGGRRASALKASGPHQPSGQRRAPCARRGSSAVSAGGQGTMRVSRGHDASTAAPPAAPRCPSTPGPQRVTTIPTAAHPALGGQRQIDLAQHQRLSRPQCGVVHDPEERHEPVPAGLLCGNRGEKCAGLVGVDDDDDPQPAPPSVPSGVAP